MAAWCLVTRQSPETYQSLSRMQRAAFIEVINSSRR